MTESTATLQPYSTRDAQLDDLFTRQREARARLDALYTQIGTAKKDILAAAWAIEGYKARSKATQQLAGVR